MIITDAALAEKIGIEKRCGYWEVGGNYFFDKSESLRFASKYNNYNVRYHFFDSAYNSLNWSIEPTESLSEMYKRRAQQLRDKYDYLILCFSGGADSTNILHSFIDNGIKLDEIYTEYPISIMDKNKNVDLSERDPLLLTYEWYTAAKPQLDKLAKTHPEIKLTIDDVSSDTIKLIENSNLHKLFRAGSSANPNTMKYYRLYEIARSREDMGRVVCITGLDKPRIAYKPSTNAFFSTYSDFNNIFAEFPEDTFSGYQATMEYFYYSYEFPQVNQKQCFVLKHAIMEVLSKNNLSLYKQLLNNSINDEIHTFDVHHDFFKKALYEKWDNNIWQAKKSANFFYTPASQWFYDKNITSDRTRDYFDKQLLELIDGINNHFILYENGKPSAFKNIMSTPIKF